jgi:hypothetical protein
LTAFADGFAVEGHGVLARADNDIPRRTGHTGNFPV